MLGSMIRLIIFIVVVLPQPDGPDQDGQLAGGEGQVELGDADRAVGVDLADPLEPDLLGAVRRSGGTSRRVGGLRSSVHGVTLLGAPAGERGRERSARSSPSTRRRTPGSTRATSWTTGTTIVRLPGPARRLTVGAVVLGAADRPPAGAARPAEPGCSPARSSACRRSSTRSRRWRCSPSSRPFTGLSVAPTVLIGLVAVLAGDPGAELPRRPAGRCPADVREAARGMGYGAARLFVQVDLPLALPAFMAGLRIATVSTVALVTVGVHRRARRPRPADRRRLQRQLLPGRDRHRHDRLRAPRAGRRPAAGRRRAAADPVDPGGRS